MTSVTARERVKFSYYFPFLLFLGIAVTVAAFIIPVYPHKYHFVFPAYYAALIGGYIFYFITLRLAIYRRTKGAVYFRLLYHIPYLVFLLPAAMVGYLIIPVLLGDVLFLTAAFGVSLVAMAIFYHLGLWLVVQTTPQSKLRFRLTAFLPLIVFVVGAGGLSAILIPVGLGNITFLSISFGVSLFFAAVLYMLGQALVFLSSKQTRVYFKVRYLIPLILYLAIAVAVALYAIPTYYENLLALSIAYTFSVFGICVAYFALVVWMLYDENKLPTSEVT